MVFIIHKDIFFRFLGKEDTFSYISGTPTALRHVILGIGFLVVMRGVNSPVSIRGKIQLRYVSGDGVGVAVGVGVPVGVAVGVPVGVPVGVAVGVGVGVGVI